MPSMSCCLVVGFTSLHKNSFISCQRFSIGLQSGDSAGVFYQFIPLSLKIAQLVEVCLGSLSCMKLYFVSFTYRLAVSVSSDSPSLRLSTAEHRTLRERLSLTGQLLAELFHRCFIVSMHGTPIIAFTSTVCFGGLPLPGPGDISRLLYPHQKVTDTSSTDRDTFGFQ